MEFHQQKQRAFIRFKRHMELMEVHVTKDLRHGEHACHAGTATRLVAAFKGGKQQHKMTTVSDKKMNCTRCQSCPLHSRTNSPAA